MSAGVLGFAAQAAQAQVTPTPLATSPYSQNFDALGNTGASNNKTTLPAGWDFLETNAGTGTGANDLYTADNGGSNGGNTYSYGATGSTERALGGLRSGSLVPSFGAAFANNTGAALTSLTVTYTGETWRIGTINRADKLSFQYSTDATSLSTGTWTGVTALDYANPGNAATTNGITTPAHSATITSTITGLNVPAGTNIWLRWTDSDVTGADDGMAIDDFSLSWGATNPTSPVLTLSAATLTFPGQNVGSTSGAQTYTLTGANLTGDVTVTATGPFTISKDNTAHGTSLTLTTAEVTTAKTLYVKFAPTATGAATGSITHTSAGAPARTLALSGTGLNPNQLSFDFQACTGTTSLSDGWTQFSVTGAQTWACTTFGRNPADPASTAAFPSAVQINGFANGINNVNEDWLISPALNLAGTNFPLLSFWSRVAFAGPAPRLKVSTNYSGTGSPLAAGVTWTDLNAYFPPTGTAAWTQTSNLNLSAYKQAGVYVAFVYTSTAADGARWTIDDVSVTNSATAPAPAIRTSPSSVAFGYQAVSTSPTQTFAAYLENLTANATISSSDPAFQVSLDGTTFASSVTVPAATAATGPVTVTVRFTPTAASRNYTGTLTLATAGATSVTVALSGNTYDVANTLEVVNWNIEWFGSTANGPTNEPQQDANVRTILNALNADVFALAEVVDTTRLRALVAAMPGYAYRVSDFGSYADNRQDPDYADAQKLAFVYRTSVISNPQFTAFFRCTEVQNCPQFNAWSSGRFPFVMTANATLGGVTKQVSFVLIHAKANTGDLVASYNRRKTGADALKAKLDTDYPTANVVILGDFNDDLDQTITAGITPNTTSYSAFTADAANYPALTLPLSLTGQKSTVSFNDMIDHVVVSNEMNAYYVPASAAVQTQVAGLVTNYANSTSDHYPILTRFSFANPTSTAKGHVAKLGLYPNPVSKSIRVEVPERSQSLQLQVHTTDGRLVISSTGSVEQLNQQLNAKVGGLHAGMYVVRIVGEQQTYVERFVKQ
ncbi:hypothetical protein GCM10027048_00040 [Hymenobacter coalescens]